MQNEISLDNLENLIKDNLAFIIKTVSNITGRYVSCFHDDEFSIALLAFMDAVKKYDESKGNFFPFAKVVIENRLKNYLKEENKYLNITSLDFLNDLGFDFYKEEEKDNLDLKDEISLYQKELEYFNLSFDDLINKAPKHIDTRIKAYEVARDISDNDEIVKETYKKRHLPIRMVSLFSKLSEKIIKRSKEFILATMIVFYKDYSQIKAWIKETRCYHAS